MSQTERELGLVVIGAGGLVLRTEDGLREATSYIREHGGDTATAAMDCAKEGVDTALVTRVGDDPLAAWLTETWDAAGVHLDYVHHSPGRNMMTLCSDRVDGGGMVTWREGVAPARLAPEDLDGVPWDRTRVVYTSGTTQALGEGPAKTALAAFTAARRAGTLTVYRPALRQAQWPSSGGSLGRAAFEALLPLTDVLLLEAPFEAGRILGRPTVDGALEELERRGVRRALVALTSRGLTVQEPDEQVTHESSSPIALDQIVGSVLAALARGESLVEATAGALESASGRKK